MSNLTVQGLISARKKELRSQAERQHHISNELQTMTWTKEDKTGRCYTYRGIQYCYNWQLNNCMASLLGGLFLSFYLLKL